MYVICGQGCHKSVYDLCMNLYPLFLFENWQCLVDRKYIAKW